MLLEASHQPNTSSFVTLTYNDDHLPEDKGLKPLEAMGFINRLRQRSGIGHVRYFLVGEYGDKTQRPHYHGALFNVPPAQFEDRIVDCWKKDGDPLGFVQVGEITRESAQYIAGYTTKKMTAKEDPRLEGRPPEFARMSKFPPLGAQGVRAIRDHLLSTKIGAKALQAKGDVPSSFRCFGKTYPLGEYWVNWLRQECGITEPEYERAWELDYEQTIKELEVAKGISHKLWQTNNRYSRRRL